MREKSARKDICALETEPDGLVFDLASVAGERITEAANYTGTRVRFKGSLGTARIVMQLDIGFGDVITPRARRMKYPTILDMSPPDIRCYSRETTIAEKFEAMTKLGIINSRMKDFYDVWLLSQLYEFRGDVPALAITKTNAPPAQRGNAKSHLTNAANRGMQAAFKLEVRSRNDFDTDLKLGACNGRSRVAVFLRILR